MSEDVLVNNGVDLLVAVAVIENWLTEKSSQLDCARQEFEFFAPARPKGISIRRFS